MKLSPSLCARTLCFVAAQAAFALLPCASSAQTSQVRQTPAGVRGHFVSSVPLYSMDLKATPLRQALAALFTNAKTEYILDDDVPDTPVTLTVRDQNLSAAVQQLLQRGGGEKKLIYTVGEGRVYRISTVPPATEPVRTRIIQVTNVRASDIINRLQTAFPSSLILPGAHAFTLVVRGPEQQNQEIDELAHLLDSGPGSVVLQAEVVLVTDNEASSGGKANTIGTAAQAKKKPIRAASGASRSTLLSTTLRTLVGQEATSDDKLMGLPAQSAKLQVVATPARLGIGAFQVDTRWDVSLPLPTGKTGANGAGLVRLEKRLTTTTRLENGETTLVGSVVLSNYGLKGEVLFFVTLNEVRYGPPGQGGPGN